MNIVRNIAGEGLIRYGNYNADTRVLGPGKRFALWLQGCCAECPGCVAPEFCPFDGGRLISIETLAEKMIADEDTEGITVSGGEPFLQADKLCALLGIVKSARPDTSVIIYSGFTYQQLRESGDKNIAMILDSYVDVLIDGRYIEELNDNRGLRGSSNQQVIFLTDKYVGNEEFLSDRKRLGHFVTEKNGGSLYMIGVPSKETQKLRSSFEKMSEQKKVANKTELRNEHGGNKWN